MCIRDRSEEIPDCTDDVQEQITLNMDLKRALDSLDTRQRELVFLRYVNELSVGKTAKILGISRFALYRKEKECMKKLKMCIRDSPGGDLCTSEADRYYGYSRTSRGICQK